jgi:hypothetical protein
LFVLSHAPWFGGWIGWRGFLVLSRRTGLIRVTDALRRVPFPVFVWHPLLGFWESGWFGRCFFRQEDLILAHPSWPSPRFPIPVRLFGPIRPPKFDF